MMNKESLYSVLDGFGFLRRLLVRNDDIQKVQLSEQDQKFIEASRNVEIKWREGNCQQGYQPYYDACKEMLKAITGKEEVDALWIIQKKPTSSL